MQLRVGYCFSNKDLIIAQYYWVDIYTNPESPAGHYADHDMFNYQFLKSAGSNLMGNSQSIESTSKVKKPVNLKPRTRKKKKKAADDGC